MKRVIGGEPPLSGWIRTATVFACTLAALFIPLQYLLVAWLAMLGGYASCSRLDWPRYQQLLAAALGGLGFGAGLQFAIGFVVHQRYVAAIAVPLLTWLVAIVLFQLAYGRYALWMPVPDPEDDPSDQKVPIDSTRADAAISAWSGDARGATPDGSLSWVYFNGGEIAMGGPTYGNVVFSNRFAFTGVGPSVALSDDGRYAAMTVPSRREWRLLLVDFVARQAHEFAGSALWEIDRIEGGRVFGRFAPITANSRHFLSVADIQAQGEPLLLADDDGWTLIDYPDRKPLPSYPVVEVPSASGAHVVCFVADQAALHANPFAREQAPLHAVSLDDLDLGFQTRVPQALWIEGEGYADPQRFVCIDHRVFDLARNVLLPLGAPDSMTNVSFGEATAGHGRLFVAATAMPRSVSFSDAEFIVSSTTFPWDEEDVSYVDLAGRSVTQQRRPIQRHYRYDIDLAAWREPGEMHLAMRFELVNRIAERHRAQFEHAWRDTGSPYSRYRCTLSCGADPGPVTHEAQWSVCGRYLAVLAYAAAPEVPDRIRIIDFETGAMRELPGRYALTSFIWFEAGLLQFTHVVGISESVTFGPGRFESREMRLRGERAITESPFDLLIGGLDARRERVNREADRRRSKPTDYIDGSVQQLAQHCILFGPDFDQPVLQGAESA